jgi:3-deoxy-manno-octulosonate cytidylyltransferase (CMP-KDO synthetase)
VATDDVRILDFCKKENIVALMTDENCKNGTERCWDVVSKQFPKPKLIINLQGDNPLCPPNVIQAMIDAYQADQKANGQASVFTPYVHLSWDEYKKMVSDKEKTPYSGTTVLIDNENFALAFSKNIIPAIRNTDKAKANLDKSPVRRHVGLYAYTYNALKSFTESKAVVYESDYIEGLEQMRFLVNGMKIKMVEADYRGRESASGVDDEADIARVEAIIRKEGELLDDPRVIGR